MSRGADPQRFQLDGQRLSSHEQSMTGLAMLMQQEQAEPSSSLMQEIPDVVPRASEEPPPPPNVEVALVPPAARVVTAVDEEERSATSSSVVSGKKRRRRRRPREATIGETETTNEEERARMLSTLKPEEEFVGDTRHLEAKRRIEELRETFGKDDWLQGRAAEQVNEVLGIQKVDTRSLTEVIAQRLAETRSKEEAVANFVIEASSLKQQPQQKELPTLQKIEQSEDVEKDLKRVVPETEQEEGDAEEGDTSGEMYSMYEKDDDEDDWREESETNIAHSFNIRLL